MNKNHWLQRQLKKERENENRALTIKEKLENIRLITDNINTHSLYPWTNVDLQWEYLEEHLNYLKIQVESIDIREDIPF
mgnify:CR=1 FL=1